MIKNRPEDLLHTDSSEVKRCWMLQTIQRTGEILCRMRNTMVRRFHVKSVAIIGAGPSGLASAKYVGC